MIPQTQHSTLTDTLFSYTRLFHSTICKNPPLLILDEPCQVLDHTQAALFNDVFDELCGFGKSLIYVGHYEAQLPGCLEKKMILEKGEVKVIEETNELVC